MLEKNTKYYQYKGTTVISIELDDSDGIYISTVYVIGNYMDLSEWFTSNFYRDLYKLKYQKGLKPSHYLPVNADNPYNDDEDVAVYKYETNDVFEFIDAIKNLPDSLDVAVNDIDYENLYSYTDNAVRLQQLILKLPICLGIYEMQKTSNENREKVGLKIKYPDAEKLTPKDYVYEYTKDNYSVYIMDLYYLLEDERPYAYVRLLADTYTEMKEMCEYFRLDTINFIYKAAGNSYLADYKTHEGMKFKDMLSYAKEHNFKILKFDDYCWDRKSFINNFNEIEDLLNDLTNFRF